MTYSQNRIVDSLHQTLKNATHDTIRAHTYNEFSEALYLESLDTVSYYSRMSIDLCLLNLSEKILKEDEREAFMRIYADAINNVGFVHSERGNYEGAMDMYYNALSIQNDIGDKKGQAWSYNNIGFIFFVEKSWDGCFENYNEALRLFQELNDQDGIGHMLNNLGVAYKQYGDTLLAIDYYQKSLENAESREDNHGIIQARNNIGQLNLQQGRIHDGIVNFQIALRTAEEINSNSAQATTKRNLGRAFFMLGEYEAAMEFALAALAGARETQRPTLELKTSRLLADIYLETEDYQLGWEMEVLNRSLADSLSTKEAQQLSVQRELEFEFEKEKAVQEARHAQDLALAKEKDKRQNLLLIGVGLLVLFLGAFAYFIFNRLKISREQNQIIDAQKKIVESKNKEITDSITYAQRIQKAIIPSNERMKSSLPASFVFYRPKDIVAGDFYWLKVIDHLRYFAVADCTGHGVPGAMVSIVCNNALNRSVLEFGLREPAEILEKTRDLVVEEFNENRQDGLVKDGMDISFCCLDPNTKELRWAGANNPLWILRSGAEEMEVLEADKQPIGRYDHNQPFQSHYVKLEEGDTIYLFSDGFPDQFGGPKGKKYYYSRFKKFLIGIGNEDLETQKEKLETELDSWKGSLEQLDDVCVMGVRL